MSRPPTPTALKVLQGTYRADRHGGQEPQPALEHPDCPELLTGEARALWEHLAPRLYRLGLLTELDAPALAATCSAYGRWHTAEKHLAEQGDVVKSPSGYPIINPYLSISKAAWKQYRDGLQEFGLSPAARTRLHVTPPTAPNAKDRFFPGNKWYGLLASGDREQDGFEQLCRQRAEREQQQQDDISDLLT